MALRCALGLALLCHGVIAGPQGPAAEQAALEKRSAPRKLHGRFLHITGASPEFRQGLGSMFENGDELTRVSSTQTSTQTNIIKYTRPPTKMRRATGARGPQASTAPKHQTATRRFPS